MQITILRSNEWNGLLPEVLPAREEPPPPDGIPHPQFSPDLIAEQLYQQQLHNWLVQNASPPNGAPDEPDVHREQDNAGWGAWPAPAAPPLPQLPPYLMNFQAWLAAQGLQVQDGIVPDNNISDNAMQAWHDSITSSEETETDSGSSTFDLLVIPDQVTAAAP